MNITTSDGVELHYREEGEGRPVLLIPGWSCTTRYFDHQFTGLSDQLRVIALDPRGQGESEKTGRGQRLARAAADVRDLIEALDLHDVTLIGWSLGGHTVMQYLELYKDDRVTRAGVIGQGPKMLKSDGWEHGLLALEDAENYRAAAEHAYPALMEGLIPQLFHTRPSDAEYEMLVAESMKTGPADGASRITWASINQDFRDLLPSIQHPFLVVLGAHDGIVPVSTAGAFKEMPNVRVEIFEGSGHAPFIEEPDKFNATLADFVLS